MNFDFGFMLEVFPVIIKYVPLTLLIAVVAMILAVIIGLLLVIIKNSNIPILTQLATLYISFFRAITMLVQLFLIYYGLPQLFPSITIMGAVTAAILAFGLKTAAYLAEIFRAALTSVDKGQLEACLSVGMTRVQGYREIVLPQATRNAMPATGNIFIGLIKETSLAFTLGVAELFAQGKMIAAASLNYLETYLALAIVYWIIVIIYSYCQKLFEKYIGRPYEV